MISSASPPIIFYITTDKKSSEFIHDKIIMLSVLFFTLFFIPDIKK